MQITTDYKTEVKLEKVIGITQHMTFLEMGNYIESIRTSLLCSDVYDEVDGEIPEIKGLETHAHMCSALSHLDLAYQALRLAHHAKCKS